MLALIQSLCIVGILAWLTAGMQLYFTKKFNRRPLPAARAVFHELRPFFLPMVVASFVLDAYLSGDLVNGWRFFNLLMNLWNWYALKDSGDDDDDRWKRRGKRLAERVQVAGHRLVVAPTP